MVHFKRVVLSLVFTLGSLISADGTTPSLRQIILGIPDDVVRGSIEGAYMAGDFDEVERGLINYLEDYDYEDSGVENVDEVKEKAMGIVYERVKETRAAAFNDLASQAAEDPDSSEGEDMDEPTVFEKAKSQLESMTLHELVAEMEEGETKTEVLYDMDARDRNMTLTDLDSYLYDVVQRSFPDMPKEHVDIMRNMINAKVDDYYGTEEFEEGADEDEDEDHSRYGGLESMDFLEIVKSIPDEEYGESKEKILQDIANGDLNKAEIDIDALLDALPNVPEEERKAFKALLHEKIMAYDPTEAASGLMEGDEEEFEEEDRKSTRLNSITSRSRMPSSA